MFHSRNIDSAFIGLSCGFCFLFIRQTVPEKISVLYSKVDRPESLIILINTPKDCFIHYGIKLKVSWTKSKADFSRFNSISDYIYFDSLETLSSEVVDQRVIVKTMASVHATKST